MLRRPTIAALALGLLASAAAPPAATAVGGARAAPADGHVSIALGRPGKALGVAGLRWRPLGRAARRGVRLALPAARIALGGAATIRAAGGVTLVSGRRKVRLTGIQVTLRDRRGLVSARVGARRMTLFSSRGRGRRYAGAGRRAATTAAPPPVRLRGAGLRLTRRAARLLRRRLGLRAIRPGPVGRLGVFARPKSGGAAGGGGGDGKGRQGATGPSGEPLSSEPPVLARPATAVDVTDVAVAWHPRDSWIRYVASGTGPDDGIHASDGATSTLATESPCPDQPSSSDAVLPYTFHFDPRPSWYDPASGTAGIYGVGEVTFRWRAHTIDLAAVNPEIEIAGGASRASFRFHGSEGTAYPNQRADLVSLDLSGQPTVSGDGKTFSYDLMRGTLTENGVNVFAGFYTPPSNDEFGCVSVSFTVP